MAFKKGTFRSVVLFMLFAAIVIGFIVYKKIGSRNELARQIAELSPKGAPPQGIEDIRKAIDLYEKQIEAHVRDAARTGIYWKILGSRLMDKELYGEALEALEQAAMYYPQDEKIHYLIGNSARILAKSEYFAEAQADSNYNKAEKAYLRAIEIDERYSKALFGIAGLYVFDINMPEEAIPYLELFLDINKYDTDGMFVLARAYYMAEKYADAVDLYDKIIELTKDPEKKAGAEANKQQTLAQWYG